MHYTLGSGNYEASPSPGVQQCVIILGDSTLPGPSGGWEACWLQVGPSPPTTCSFLEISPLFIPWNQLLLGKPVICVSEPKILKVQPLTPPWDKETLVLQDIKPSFPSRKRKGGNPLTLSRRDLLILHTAHASIREYLPQR